MDLFIKCVVYDVYLFAKLFASYGYEEIDFSSSCAAYKCKAIPLQALTGHEGSRRLRLPDFKTIGT
jgi:hypothetical protein